MAISNAGVRVPFPLHMTSQKVVHFPIFTGKIVIYNREQKNLNTLTPSRFVGVEGARAKFFLTERDISAPAVCNERGVNPIPLSYSQS